MRGTVAKRLRAQARSEFATPSQIRRRYKELKKAWKAGRR